MLGFSTRVVQACKGQQGASPAKAAQNLVGEPQSSSHLLQGSRPGEKRMKIGIFLALQMVIAAMKLKDAYSLEEKL